MKIIDFKEIGDERGSLVALESNKNIPFEIKRVYYIYGTPEGVMRGFHAHKNLKQVVVAVSGACTFVLDDGRTREEVRLDNPAKGLFIGNNTWREMKDFTPDCVIMVLASEYYAADDYIRDYAEFVRLAPTTVGGG